MAEATYNTPATRTSETKYTARSFNCSQASGSIEVSVADASNAEIRVLSFTFPNPAFPSATVIGFLTAIGTVRGGESGTVLNKANYRLLGFLLDNGYISGITLNP